MLSLVGTHVIKSIDQFIIEAPAAGEHLSPRQYFSSFSMHVACTLKIEHIILNRLWEIAFMKVNFIVPVYAAEHIALTMENEDNSTVTADINIEQRKAKLEKALDVSALILV